MSSNPPSYWERAYGLVSTNLSEMNARADETLAEALAIMDALQNLNFTLGGMPPRYNLDIVPPPDVDLPQKPPLPEIDGLPNYERPEFDDDVANTDVSSILNANPLTGIPFNLILPYQINNPDPPVQGAIGQKPDKPTNLPEINFPEFNPDDYPFPAPPQYMTIGQITLPQLNLASFNAQAPVFAGDLPDLDLQFEPGTYSSDLLDTLIAKINEMLQGSIGLAPSIEQALYDRARAREDITAKKALEDVTSKWASMGYSLPPGAMIRAQRAAVEANQLQVNSLSRDILIKAEDVRIENIRAALSAGIEVEGRLMTLFGQMRQLSFEIVKAKIDARVQTFNLLVSAYQVAKSVFDAQIAQWDAQNKYELAKLELTKAQADIEKSKADINVSLARAYSEEVSAISAKIGVIVQFAQVEASKGQVISALMAAYREELEAWQKEVDASLFDFKRFETEAGVEESKARVNAAYAQAYGETLQAAGAAANVKARAIEVRLEAIRTATAKMTAEADVEGRYIAALAQRVQAQTQAFSASTDMYRADVALFGQEAELEIRRTSDNLRNALAYYEIQVKEYDAQQARLIELTRLQEAAIEGAGRMASQLAAGAMAAINVGANLSGNASSSDSYTIGKSQSVNWNLDGEDGSPPVI